MHAGSPSASYASGVGSRIELLEDRRLMAASAGPVAELAAASGAAVGSGGPTPGQTVQAAYAAKVAVTAAVSHAAALSPMIKFTKVPAYGDKQGLVRGKVANVSPAKYAVAVVIEVNGTLWTKPTWAAPLTPIRGDHTWQVITNTGGMDYDFTTAYAFIVPRGFDVPLLGGERAIPQALVTASVASAVARRSPPSPGNALVGGPGMPAVTLTSVPKTGTSDDLFGRVVHVRPAAVKVATVIRVGGGYWSKPFFAQPAVPVGSDGRFEVDVTTGDDDAYATELWVFVVPADYDVPLVGGGDLPADLSRVALVSAVARRG